MFEIFTRDLIEKFIRFCVVGFSGVFVDFGFTYISKERMGIQKYLSNAIGFSIAASSNYVLNRIWTFHSENPDIASEYLLFIFFSLIGLGINTVVLWLLVSKAKWNFYFSKLFAIGAVTVWNFVVNYLFTFTA
ncbi:MAG: GtrA family protein [Bacteroidales bacterium]|nr:GtrA family protein [Bacteroidales bacterium]